MTNEQLPLVIRDRDGHIWMRPQSKKMFTLGGYTWSSQEALASAYGPLIPILDADGRPVLRRITTVEELEALPSRSVIMREADEWVYQKVGGWWYKAGSSKVLPGNSALPPVVVLYEPAPEPAPKPDPVEAVRRLHWNQGQRFCDSSETCGHCQHLWPCPTIVAIGGE